MDKYKITWACRGCTQASLLDEGDSVLSSSGSHSILRIWAQARCAGCSVSDVRLYPMVHLRNPIGQLEWGTELLRAIVWDAFMKGYRITMDPVVAGEVGLEEKGKEAFDPHDIPPIPELAKVIDEELVYRIGDGFSDMMRSKCIAKTIVDWLKERAAEEKKYPLFKVGDIWKKNIGGNQVQIEVVDTMEGAVIFRWLTGEASGQTQRMLMRVMRECFQALIERLKKGPAWSREVDGEFVRGDIWKEHDGHDQFIVEDVRLHNGFVVVKWLSGEREGELNTIPTADMMKDYHRTGAGYYKRDDSKPRCTCNRFHEPARKHSPDCLVWHAAYHTKEVRDE